MTRTIYITSMLAGAIVLGGCASKKSAPATTGMDQTHGESAAQPVPESVPAYSNEVKSGNGALSYTAEANGTLYLVDDVDNAVLYSGRLSKDQAFALDPDARRATIDGKYVFTREIYPSHRHRIYFTAD